MANFKFKVAYTEDPSKIEPAIDAGTIDEGDLIIVNEDGVGSMKFITNKKKLIGMNAELTDEEKQLIIDQTLSEADSRYLVASNLILNGNSSLIAENNTEVNSYSALLNALEDDSITGITLSKDVIVNAPIIVKERDLTIDLAGHKLSNEQELWGDNSWSILSVENATLVLEDSSNTGAVDALKDDCYTIDIRDNGTVYINGGTYNSNITAVYLFGENSACYITGGYFKIQQLNTNGEESPYGLTINIYNSVRNSAKCIITGGTFEGYNPAEPEEGDITYLPEGYITQYDSDNNTYTVVKEE